jgi:hypothetical protein
MPSLNEVTTISDIQLKVTYGYTPNIRTIIQTISASNLKQGLNTIKIEDTNYLKKLRLILN